jgi:hypothetical protein
VIYFRKVWRITGTGIILNNHLSKRRRWARKGEAIHPEDLNGAAVRRDCRHHGCELLHADM